MAYFFYYFSIMPKNDSPLETREQKSFVNWVTLTHPELDGLWCAIPNGGLRDMRTAVTMKQEGLKPGWPDLQFMIPKGIYCGLFIEMKRQTGGTVSKDQKRILNRLESHGYRCEIAKGDKKARKILQDYLDLA